MIDKAHTIMLRNFPSSNLRPFQIRHVPSIVVPLSDPTCHLLGPFDFQPRLLASDRRSVVAPHRWDALLAIYQARGVIPLPFLRLLNPVGSPDLLCLQRHTIRFLNCSQFQELSLCTTCKVLLFFPLDSSCNPGCLFFLPYLVNTS